MRQLYQFPLSPFSRKVRLVLAEKRLPFEMRTEKPWERREEYLQLNPAGSAQSISGQPPFRLVVGNASGVRVLFNDRSVDLAPYTQVDVARLTLE